MARLYHKSLLVSSSQNFGGNLRGFFQREFLQLSIERYQIQRVIYDPEKEVIVRWIK